MFKRLFKVTGMQTPEQRRDEIYRNVLRHEAKIGGELFGPVPNGGHREFFCLDPYTWVWYEEWVDNHGNKQNRTIRYSVRPDVILKSLDGKQYQETTDLEVSRLVDAVKAYKRRVEKEVFHSVTA